MRVIIAGSRSVENYTAVVDAVEKSGFEITEIISGTARGADRLGERYAREHGIPLKKMPAEWNKYGKKAGYLRNVDMAIVADALILVWDGSSRGSAMMKKIAEERGLKIFEKLVY